jgi:signal transduction histidine kinase
LTEPKQKSVVVRAQKEVDRLTSLTDRLLDVARMAGGHFELERTRMDLSELATEVGARMEEEAERSSSKISVSAPAPVEGFWDRTRLDQVMTNLVANAIKFGGGKPIEIRVLKNGDRAIVRVRDYGLGVAEADRDRIFERFERGVSERSYAGLGLGLWIARQIVNAHGGWIGVTAPEGPGAEFSLEIPADAGGSSADTPRR